MEQRIKICPECNGEINARAFVSRKDNKTPICLMCALVEAFQERSQWQQAVQQSSNQ